MQLRKILLFSGVLAAASTVVAGLVETSNGDTARFVAWLLIERFVVVFVFAAFGLVVARGCQLKGALFLDADREDVTFVVRDVLIFGVLPGLVLGLINYFFFFAYRYSPFITPRIREMSSVYESFMISLDSGMTEEVIYRLFMISSLVFSIRHLYARLNQIWPSAVAFLPMVLALVLSSLLFALVHPVNSFTAAFFGGMLLGLIYLKSGVESSIAAHFCANFLFFSLAYLS